MLRDYGKPLAAQAAKLRFRLMMWATASSTSRRGASGHFARPLQVQAAKMWFSLQTYEAEGVGHSFFNDPPWRERTLWQIDRFLAKHGYLQGDSTLNLPGGTILKRSE